MVGQRTQLIAHAQSLLTVFKARRDGPGLVPILPRQTVETHVLGWQRKNLLVQPAVARVSNMAICLTRTSWVNRERTARVPVFFDSDSWDLGKKSRMFPTGVELVTLRVLPLQ